MEPLGTGAHEEPCLRRTREERLARHLICIKGARHAAVNFLSSSLERKLMAVPSLRKLTVAPNPSLSGEVNEIRLHTAKIVSNHVTPNEQTLGLPTEDHNVSSSSTRFGPS